MRIAVCISGHLVQKVGRDSLIDNAQKIQQFFKKLDSQVDYFLYFSHNEKTDQSLLDFYENFPNTVSKKIFEDISFPLSQKSYKNIRAETHVERTFKMFEKIYACNQLKSQYENQIQSPYDIVFRIRPDMIFLEEKLEQIQLFISDLKKSTVYIPKFPWLITKFTQADFFAFGDSDSMNIYSNTFTQIDSIYNKGVLFHPETILGFQLYQNNIKVQHIDPVCYFTTENMKLNGFEGKKSKLLSPYYMIAICKYLFNSYKPLF